MSTIVVPTVNVLDYSTTGNEAKGYPNDASAMFLSAFAAAAAMPIATVVIPHADALGYYYNSATPLSVPQSVIVVADPGTSIVGGPATTDCFHFLPAQATDGYPVAQYGEIHGTVLPEIIGFTNGRGVWWDGRNGLLGDVTIPRIAECSIGISADATNGSVALAARVGSIIACNHGVEMVNHQTANPAPNGFQGVVVYDCYFHGCGWAFYMDFNPTTYATAYNGLRGNCEFDGTFTQSTLPGGQASVGAAIRTAGVTNGIGATSRTLVTSELIFEVELYSDDFQGGGAFVACPRLNGSRLAIGTARTTGYNQWITSNLTTSPVFAAPNAIVNRNRLNPSNWTYVPASVSVVGVGPGRAAWNGGASQGPFNDVPLWLGGPGAAVPAGVTGGGVVTFCGYHLFANGASTPHWTPTIPSNSWAAHLDGPIAVRDNSALSGNPNEVLVQYVVRPGQTTDGTESLKGFVSIGR